MFDFSCPWSWLATERLFSLLDDRPDITPDFTWRPFLLDPAEFTPGRLTRLARILRDQAAEQGLSFSPGALSEPAPTVDAHRLIAWLSSRTDAEPAVRYIFHARFSENRDISDREVLTAAAGACGMEPERVLPFLSGKLLAGHVSADHRLSARRGLNGIPVVLAGPYAITGLQDKPVYERLLDAAATAIRADSHD
ncbi:DsbA family protein [Acetobacter sp. AN02]|uniref:DsbA family oxidoreductase n=1 Tax=Acetobacter sp. AN02 TaxID=2894186 RepID=UPI00243425E0|nr:DsbA family protein [Acetobacter sp. AN02]